VMDADRFDLRSRGSHQVKRESEMAG
jgi:hypothetical protein